MRTPGNVRVVYTSDIENAALHEDAVDAFETLITQHRLAEEDAKPRGFTLMVKRIVKDEVEDDGTGLAGPGALAYGLKKIRDWGKALLASKLWVQLAKRVVKGASRIGRMLVRVAGRLIIRSLILPLFTAVGAILASPVGLAAVSIAAAGGLGYWLYRKYFKGEPASEDTKTDEQEGLAAYGRKMYTSPKDWASTEAKIVTESGPPIKTEISTYTPSASALKRAQDLLGKRTEDVKTAIKEAAKIVGLSEHTLTAFAAKESAFNPNAKAKTSTAAGLFQFLKGTWKYVVERYGKMYGLDSKSNPYNARDSAIAAAAYLKHDIYPSISKAVGVPNATDLYFGHFMGPVGGSNFLRNRKADGTRFAYLDFKKEAAANRSVYFKGGDLNDPRTYDEIYAMFNSSLGTVEQLSIQETTPVVPTAEVSPNVTAEMAKRKVKEQVEKDKEGLPVAKSAASRLIDYFRYGNAVVAVN